LVFDLGLCAHLYAPEELDVSQEQMARSASPATTGAVRPGDPREAADLILTHMRRALNDPEFGAGDDFFAHGGDSILAIQVVVDLQTATGVELLVAYFYTSPTAEELGELFAQLLTTADDRAIAT
jgi:hypothetical protein